MGLCLAQRSTLLAGVKSEFLETFASHRSVPVGPIDSPLEGPSNHVSRAINKSGLSLKPRSGMVTVLTHGIVTLLSKSLPCTLQSFPRHEILHRALYIYMIFDFIKFIL